MSSTQLQPARQDADQFGHAVAARLSHGTADLPYEVRERLRAARVRAIESRQPAASPEAMPLAVGRGGIAAWGQGDGDRFGWGRGLASVLPLLVLAAGLVLLHMAQGDYRATEVAEVDQALLTDDLPPAAYADPGFVHFLKSARD